MKPSLPLCCCLFVLTACNGDGTSPDGSSAPPVTEGVWLKGDLHLHSHHSDDATDNELAEIVSIAEERGMDYFLVTDHDNHVDGALTTWGDPAYRSDNMVMLYGAEWTTNKGHANFVSAEPYDHLALYRLRDGDGGDVARLARRMDVHFSANHPLNSDPWLYGFDDVDSVEVWNALFKFPSDNGEVLSLWDDLLKGGMRMPGRGGSDCHHQEGIQPLGLNVGTPTTWVYARDRTGDAVVEALDAGRASVSYAPDAERIELRADADGDGVFETLMGGNVPVPGGEVTFRVDIVGYRPLGLYEVTVVRNGEVLAQLRPTGPELTFSDTPEPGGRTYYRGVVRGTTPEAETPPAAPLYGGMVGLTNPVYFGYE